MATVKNQTIITLETLFQKLKTELSGILNWALEGCADWLRNVLIFPEEVQIATREYRDRMDVLADFLYERCQVDVPDDITSSDLYKAYKGWCEDAGERTVSQTRFSLMLEERDFVKEVRRDHSYWVGIRLKNN